MKKMMIMMLAVLAIAAASCSKEAKINRKINGDWKAITYNGNAVQSGQSFTASFSKDDKNTGTGTSSYADNNVSFTKSFTYVLAEDKLTFTTTFGSVSTSETVTVNTYTKDKLQWTDSDGDITVLEPQ